MRDCVFLAELCRSQGSRRVIAYQRGCRKKLKYDENTSPKGWIPKQPSSW